MSDSDDYSSDPEVSSGSDFMDDEENSPAPAARGGGGKGKAPAAKKPTAAAPAATKKKATGTLSATTSHNTAGGGGRSAYDFDGGDAMEGIDEEEEGDDGAENAPAAAKAPRGGNNNKGRKVEDVYKKLSQLEHILLRPDTYIGSTEKQTATLWVFDGDSLSTPAPGAGPRLSFRQVTYAPGLYKIFDEILVNAADHKVRDASMDTLKVDIDPSAGLISVWNNGGGIPVEIHKGEGVYVPELIFGHLLTSSNYDDDEKKVTGGRNGYGAKLANIFSTRFVVETADGSRSGKKYRQVFESNMSRRSEPEVTSCKSSENWTRIAFQPDLPKFDMREGEPLEGDTVALMKKRVLDVAGVLGRGVKVFLNGERVPVRNFSEYVDLYLGPSSGEGAVPRVIERVSGRWEVAVAATDGQFQQVSFVNSVCTIKGGTHVNAVVDQVCKLSIALVVSVLIWLAGRLERERGGALVVGRAFFSRSLSHAPPPQPPQPPNNKKTPCQVPRREAQQEAQGRQRQALHGQEPPVGLHQQRHREPGLRLADKGDADDEERGLRQPVRLAARLFGARGQVRAFGQRAVVRGLQEPEGAHQERRGQEVEARGCVFRVVRSEERKKKTRRRRRSAHSTPKTHKPLSPPKKPKQHNRHHQAQRRQRGGHPHLPRLHAHPDRGRQRQVAGDGGALGCGPRPLRRVSAAVRRKGFGFFFCLCVCEREREGERERDPRAKKRRPPHEKKQRPPVP
jgi:hypothetical protein